MIFIGEVDDIYHKKVNENGRRYESPWQKRRIYQDELDEYNSRNKNNLICTITYGNGKTIKYCS